jgi:hypothetical protein
MLATGLHACDTPRQRTSADDAPARLHRRRQLQHERGRRHHLHAPEPRSIFAVTYPEQDDLRAASHTMGTILIRS